MTTETVALPTMEELIGQLGREIDLLEQLLFPPAPRSRSERAAELGLHVVEDGDDG